MLRDPGIDRVACDGYVHHASRGQLDDEEGEERPTEEVNGLQEGAGPDVAAISAELG